MPCATLSDEQRAILAPILEGKTSRVIVSAPPGTGKTRASVRIARVAVEEGVLQGNQNALLLTFSVSARAQLEAYAREDGIEYNCLGSSIAISNFHSFYQDYIWAYRSLLGLPETLIVESPEQRERFLASVLPGASKKQRGVLCAAMDARIPGCRLPTGEVLPEETVAFAQASIENHNREGRLHFDDFAYWFWVLLQRDQSLQRILRAKYPLLILDEYQDASDAQHAIVDLLSGENGAVIGFGDEMQCIHGWRGAIPTRLEEIDRDKSARRVALAVAHRYKDLPDLERTMCAAREALRPGGSGTIACIPDVLQISRYGGQGDLRGWDVFAEVHRLALREIVRKEVASVGVMFRRKDAVIHCRQYMAKRGLFTSEIGTRATCHNAVGRLLDDLRGERLDRASTVMALLGDLMELDQDFAEVQKNPKGKFRCPRRASLARLVLDIVRDTRPLLSALPALVAGLDHLPSCERHREWVDRDIQRLLREMARACDKSSPEEHERVCMGVFLQEEYRLGRRALRGISVLTAHQAKGREFDTVILGIPIIPGLELFDFDCRSDEERRLLYVILTRAKKRVFIVPSRSGSKLVRFFASERGPRG